MLETWGKKLSYPCWKWKTGEFSDLCKRHDHAIRCPVCPVCCWLLLMKAMASLKRRSCTYFNSFLLHYEGCFSGKTLRDDCFSKQIYVLYKWFGNWKIYKRWKFNNSREGRKILRRNMFPFLPRRYYWPF